MRIKNAIPPRTPPIIAPTFLCTPVTTLFCTPGAPVSMPKLLAAAWAEAVWVKVRVPSFVIVTIGTLLEAKTSVMPPVGAWTPASGVPLEDGLECPVETSPGIFCIPSGTEEVDENVEPPENPGIELDRLNEDEDDCKLEAIVVRLGVTKSAQFGGWTMQTTCNKKGFKSEWNILAY